MIYDSLAYELQEILWDTYTAYVPGFYEADAEETETMLETAARDLVRLIQRKGYVLNSNGGISIPGRNMDSYEYMDRIEELEIAYMTEIRGMISIRKKV